MFEMKQDIQEKWRFIIGRESRVGTPLGNRREYLTS